MPFGSPFGLVSMFEEFDYLSGDILDMRIQKCEHPVRIYNKYSKEWQYVPCGKCPSCLRSKSLQWIERLNVERRCWKYALFFTLTYANENVPRLKRLDNWLVDVTHKHTAPNDLAPILSLKDVMLKCSPEERDLNQRLLSTYDEVPYLSVYDAQCFIKRYRKNLKTYITSNYETYIEADYQVRYYLIGEYGPTTYRPHYHGLLFFSSEKQAACAQELLSKSWKLGIVDTSYVAESNASYLAKYLNCYTGLPTILQQPGVRPFAIYSKCPPIGTLYFNDAKIQEIFLRRSPTMLVDYLKGISLADVPVWRTFTDRLFPKISGYSRLTHFDRVRLYSASLYFKDYAASECSSADFSDFILKKYNEYQTNQFTKVFGHFYLKSYHHYVADLQSHDCDLRAAVIRWWNVSSRVCTQAAVFGMSVADYVGFIEDFYSNCDYEKLKIQYHFQELYSEEYGCQSLVGLDKLFLESVLDVPLELMSAEEITILEGYGIDVEKFTSPDLSVRLSYQSLILPEETRNYRNMVLNNKVWLKKFTKNKVKNDYLEAHPEFKFLIV